MRVRLLGRPAIAGDDGPIELRGPRQAGLLALLATEVGRVVRTSRIEDELWDGQRVSESAVRVNVNRLRARFLAVTGADPIVSHTLGYALDIDPDDIDTNQFVADARAVTVLRGQGHAARAADQAEAADRRWRGPAFEGVTDLPSVRPEHDRLEALRGDVRQERAAAIELGELDDALTQLDILIGAAPYREAAWSLRLYALARSGRRDEAGARYRQLVQLLHDDLGIVPEPTVTALAEAIRSGDPDPSAGRSLLDPTRPAGEPGRPRGSRVIAPRRDRERPSGPFIGRAELVDEVTKLVLAPGRDGADGTIAIVDGSPGIGKTRFAEEVADHIVRAGGIALVGTCPRSGGSSVTPLADILAGALEAGGPHEDAGLDALASLVPGSFPGTDAARDPDPEIRRLQLFDAAARALIRLGPAPVLVVVDDLQWVSTDSARFLHHLVDRTDVAWLVVTRPGGRSEAAVELLADLARWQPTWRTLEPLPAADIATLVREIAPAAPAEVADTVVDRCGGNPFFATELLRHLLAGGRDTEVPPGLEQLVHAGLGRLAPATIRVAETLAVAREPLPVAMLARICEPDVGTIDDALGELVAAGFATTSGAGAHLNHDIIVEVVDTTVGPVRRDELHTAIGRALVRGGASSRPAALDHLLQGDPAITADELDLAAAATLHHLNDRAAYHETIRVGDRFLAAVGGTRPSRAGLDARVQLASALLIAGSYGRGIALLDQIDPAIRREAAPALSADAILARATINVADPELAVRVDEARLVLDAIDRTDTHRRVQLASWIAHHLALLGRTQEALAVLDRADDENRFAMDPSLQGSIMGGRMQIATGVGTSPAVYRATYEELCRFTDEHDAAPAEMWRLLAELDLAVRDGTLDDHAAAIAGLATFVERFPRPDLRWSVEAALAGNALGRGDLDAAERLIVAAQVAGGELSVGSAAALWITQLFLLQYERGDLAVMTPFLSALTDSSSHYQLAARALLHIESGDAVRARDMAARLGERERILATAGAGWAAIASQLGDIAYFAGEARLAEATIAELGPHRGTTLSAHGLLHLGAADRVLGLAWATLGDLDRAIELLDAAHTSDRQRGAARWSARAARSAAALRRLRRNRGDIAAARVLDQEAARLLSAAAPSV